MEEWKTYRLEDLTIDGKGHYGIGAPAVDYDENKFTYLRITDINDDGSLNYSGLKSVDDPEASKYLLQEGDIVFARTGNSTGRSYYYEPSDGQFVFAGFLIKFSLDPTKVNPRFLKYYTHSKMYYEWVQSFDTGATRGNINAQTFGSMEINLPPRKVQDRLVEILRSIDDKIKLNNRINHNLEEQAQALYKSWFVDFEPFKGGDFVDSELGLIPEGWRVGTLSELGDIVAGGTPSKTKPEYYTNNGIAWLTPKDLSIKCNKFTARGEIDITEDGYKNSSAKLMPRGSVLFSSRAPIGYISIAKGDICTNQGFKSVVPTYAGTAYLYYWLCENTEAIEAQASGSTFKEASGSLMRSFPALVPEKSVIDSFEKELSPILNEQEILEEEIYHAEQIRDSLLPRLMSGEFIMNC